MKIIDIVKQATPATGGTSSCDVHLMHIEVADVGAEAASIIKQITDTSWIQTLDIFTAAAYAARANRTIERLVTNVLSTVEDQITQDFGEYLVSVSAQRALVEGCDHNAIPLPELWKEKISGNPGFDFHSVCPEKFITFGEAKYSSEINPYTIALRQISDFIDSEKDTAELSDLKNFFCAESLTNHVNGQKAFAAAFFINSANPKSILENAQASIVDHSLLAYRKLYLIGVCVNA